MDQKIFCVFELCEVWIRYLSVEWKKNNVILHSMDPKKILLQPATELLKMPNDDGWVMRVFEEG